MEYFYCYIIDNRYWVYDRYTNQIAEVDKIVFEIFKTSMQHKFHRNKVINIIRSIKEEKLIEKLDKIKNFQKNQNAFKIYNFKTCSVQRTDEELKQKYENELFHIIFNITDDCNLRCEYCKFSGNYNGTKKLRKKGMSYDIIDKSIDFIKRYYKNQTTLMIGFYGGEPLLEYKKMKYIINKVRGVYKNVRFSLSTNGLLLSDEKISFFEKNNVSIKISIDGPENIHNRYRRTIKNSPSFSIIENKLKSIKEKYESYYMDKIGFLVTLAPPYQIDHIISYLEKIVTLNNPVIFNFVDPYDTLFFDKFDQKEVKENKKRQINQLQEEYFKGFKAANQGIRMKLLDDLFGKNYLQIEERSIFPLSSNIVFPNAACFPGLDRLYISTDGNLYMCEKVGESLVIGDIFKGFDFEKIKNIMSTYCSIVEKVCLECWAYRLCQTCYVSALKNRKLDISRKLEDCKRRKKGIINLLQSYTKTKMYNPNAFKNSKEYPAYPV